MSTGGTFHTNDSAQRINSCTFVCLRTGLKLRRKLLSITATKTGCGPIVNQIGAALVRRIKRAFQEGARFKASHVLLIGCQAGMLTILQVIVCIPEVPGFAGDIKTEGSLKIIMAAQYRSINRGGSSIYEELRDAGIEP